MVETSLGPAWELARLMPEPSMAVSPKGEIRGINSAAADWLGVAASELPGQPVGRYIPLSPGKLLGLLEAWSRNPSPNRHRLPFVRPGKSSIFLECEVYPLPADEEPLVLLRWQDGSIPTPAEMEETVRQLAGAFAHEDLVELAGALSHDLHEPVRKVVAYLGLLEKELGIRQTDKARQILTTVQSGGKRMQLMLERMLAYVKLSDRRLDWRTVELGQVVDDILTELEPELNRIGASVQCGSLPEVRGDAVLLGRLLRELIANAIKFRRKNSPLELSIEAACDSQQCIIRVRDNGVGFDAEASGRIFKLFERLHPVKEYPGLGYGLAEARKIAKKHGGRLWATSVPGMGATFSLGLPTPPSGDSIGR